MSERATKRSWRIFNTLNIGWCLFAGYNLTAPQGVFYRADTDFQYLVLIILVVTTFFSFSLFPPFQGATLRYPSWDRSPFDWNRDPLQALFVATVSFFAMALASTYGLSTPEEPGLWTAAALWCFAAGLLLGQIVGYAVFRKRIVKASDRTEISE